MACKRKSGEKTKNKEHEAATKIKQRTTTQWNAQKSKAGKVRKNATKQRSRTREKTFKAEPCVGFRSGMEGAPCGEWESRMEESWKRKETCGQK